MQRKLIKELFETNERLAKNEAKWFAYRGKVIAKVFAKIERKGESRLSREEKIALSEHFEIVFYRGKIMAYTFALQELHGGKFEIDGNKFPYFYEWSERQDAQGTISCSHLPKQAWNKK